MNPENEEALERLLIEDLDRFDEETMVLLRTHDEDKRNSLLNRIDAQVAQNFPSGSALFNKRLSEENFPDPDDAVVREILERARSMKEKGHTFSYVDCLVVDLLLSNSTSGSCEIPDDF